MPPSLTVQQARELFDHNAEIGTLTWKIRPVTRPHDVTWNKRYAGKVAGCKMQLGYLVCCVNYERIYVHRLIWLIAYGQWPIGDIDHIDGNRANNILSNLRDTAHSDNLLNAKRSLANTSGIKGVSPSGGKWLARVTRRGTIHHGGYFDNKEDAEQAVRAIRERAHGEYTNHGGAK